MFRLIYGCDDEVEVDQTFTTLAESLDYAKQFCGLVDREAEELAASGDWSIHDGDVLEWFHLEEVPPAGVPGKVPAPGSTP